MSDHLHSAHRLLLLLALALLAPACGPVPGEWECGPDTCNGCCLNGRCESGLGDQACGARGSQCNVCVGGQTCRQNVCAFGTGGGAGGGAAGGAGGGAAGGQGGGAAGGQGGGAAGGQGGGSACVPETDAELCTQAGRRCGQHYATDRCGTARPILSCGSCAAGSSCSGQGQCVCTPESNQALCTRLGKVCGGLTATDNCGNARTVTTCGTCQSPNTCTTQGTCACTPETDAQLCTRAGRACGSLTMTDNCGRSRSVSSCGTCAGNNTCSAGVCSCPSESSYAFCQRLGATCGAVSGTDLCGNPKSVSSCGTCSGYATCGGGGTANQCGCTPQTTADFCAARSKDCGTVTGLDNCGGSRSVDCGTCTLPETCGGLGVANVCACQPETNTAFCSRLGKSCGAVTAADNCGTQRTVASCGSCTSPQTCGGSGLPNVCGCAGESDAAFCARLGKSCGQVSGTDTCGNPRTVQSCGTCGGGTSCGTVGASANTCLRPVTFPSTGVCTPNGFCMNTPTTTMLPLQDVWVDATGEVWATGGDGLVLRSKGGVTRGLLHLRAETFNAIWARSENEVWVGGPAGLVLRFNGTTWDDLSIPGGKDVNDLFGDSLGAVWAGGDDNLIRRWTPGTGWTTPASLPSSYRDITGVMQVGTDMRFLTLAGQYAWPMGSTSTAVTAVRVDDTWHRYSSQAVASATESYLAFQTWSNYSSDYYQHLSKYVAGTEVSVSLPTYTLSANRGDSYLAVRSTTDVDLFASTWQGWHFDGFSWTRTTVPSSAPVDFTSGHGNAGTVAYVGQSGALFERSGTTWTRRNDWNFPTGITLPSGSSVVPISSTRALVSLSQSTPPVGGYPSARVLALWTDTGWTAARALTGSVTSGWSPDGTVVWAVEYGSASNTLLRFNGSAWEVKGVLAGQLLPYVGGHSDTDFWLTGQGRVVHCLAGNCTDSPTPFSGTTEAITLPVAVSASLAFVRVGENLVLRWNGTDWQVDANFPGTEKVYALWKSPQGTVWAAGTAGLQRCVNGVWSKLTLPAGYLLGGVLWGASDTNLSVNADTQSAGRFDTVLTWNGSTWSTETYPPGFFNGMRLVTLGGRTWAHYAWAGFNLPGDKGGWSRPVHILSK